MGFLRARILPGTDKTGIFLEKTLQNYRRPYPAYGSRWSSAGPFRALHLQEMSFFAGDSSALAIRAVGSQPALRASSAGNGPGCGGAEGDIARPGLYRIISNHHSMMR